MIISASRRTDIPAFFSSWFINRVRCGYCTTFNPFNRKQVSYVSLRPEDVEVIVFWTKNPRPLLPSLRELDELGLRYYFQYTLNGYPQVLETNLPTPGHCVDTFCELSDTIGPQKVIWRYDPILLSNLTDVSYHQERFASLAEGLRRKTKRVVISVVDNYRKAAYNFRRLAEQGVQVQDEVEERQLQQLMRFIVRTAEENGLTVFSCAETLDLEQYGVRRGKCIDDAFIKDVFDTDVTHNKDRNQRAECGCVVSKDIGAYDTCLHGCSYCYAGTLAAGKKNREQHYPDSPSILGRYDAERPDAKREAKPEQLRLL